MLSDELKVFLNPVRLGAHTVPGIWRYMMPEDLMYFRVDPEVRSSCFACPKVKEAGFHPDVRCCTVIPRVPNFLLGMASLSGSSEVSALIDRGLVLPEGLLITPLDLRRSLDFIVRPNQGLPNIVCPMLDQNSKRCLIYAFRNTTCSSFHCKHDRGVHGGQFWSDIADLGSQIETSLAQWGLQQIGFDLGVYFAALDNSEENFSEGFSMKLREALFGEWFGREEKLLQQIGLLMFENRKDLFAIAAAFRPLQSPVYDARLRSQLADEFPSDLLDEALPVGEAESMSHLWYRAQLSHRNLQLAPKA